MPAIQGLVVLTGLYLGISRGGACLKDRLNDPGKLVKAMVLPALLALLVANVLLRLYMG